MKRKVSIYFTNKPQSFQLTCWIVIYSLTYAFHQQTDWWMFRKIALHLNGYADLASVLRVTECFGRFGLDPYEPSREQCPSDQYIYGRTLVILFDFLGLRSSALNYLALLLTICLIFIMALVSTHITISQKINPLLIFSISLSPGIWLLFERLNIDALILIFLSLTVFLISRNKFLLGFTAVGFTALFKFYTAPLMLLIYTLSSSRKIKSVILVSSLAISLVIFVNLRSIPVELPSTWFVSFGTPIVGFYLSQILETVGFTDYSIPSMTGHALGLLLFLLVVLSLKKFVFKSKYVTSDSKSTNTKVSLNDLLIMFFGGVFLTCFLAGMSYDYRLVYLAISGTAVLPMITNERFSWIYRLLLLCSLWLGSFSFGITVDPVLVNREKQLFWISSLLGDISMFFVSGVIMLVFIRILHRTRAAVSWSKLRIGKVSGEDGLGSNQS